MDVCMYLYTEKKEGNGNDLPPPLSSTGLRRYTSKIRPRCFRTFSCCYCRCRLPRHNCVPPPRLFFLTCPFYAVTHAVVLVFAGCSISRVSHTHMHRLRLLTCDGNNNNSGGDTFLPLRSLIASFSGFFFLLPFSFWFLFIAQGWGEGRAGSG